MEDINTMLDLVPTCSDILSSQPLHDNTIEKDEAELSESIGTGSKMCPLCSSEVKFFFIHFNEKMLMCENVECEFPFGYEDLQFSHVEEETVSDTYSFRTKPSLMSPSCTASVISTAAWSEIDRMNKVFDSEDSQQERPYVANVKNKELDKESIDQIQKNVEDIKGLNMELIELSEPKRILKNEKWIKKLLHLQGPSLLKPAEINQLKPDPIINIEPGTIKIDILF